MSRILIIEDTPANLLLTTAILEGGGHRTLSAPSAEQGPRIASTEPIEVILMDMRLPGIDGMTATRLLAQGRPQQVCRPLLEKNGAAGTFIGEVRRALSHVL